MSNDDLFSSPVEYTGNCDASDYEPSMLSNVLGHVGQCQHFNTFQAGKIEFKDGTLPWWFRIFRLRAVMRSCSPRR